MVAALMPTMSFAQITEVKTSGYFEKLPNWKISPSVPGTTCGLPGGDDADISQPDYDTTDWIDAVAPSTVLGNLIDAGVYDDFFMNLNGSTDEWYNRQFTNIPANDFAQRWWYSTDFTIPASEAGKRVTLAIGGMSYHADMYINGELVKNNYTYITSNDELLNGPPVYDGLEDITGSNQNGTWAAQFGTAGTLDQYQDEIVGSFRRFDIDITDYVHADGSPNNVKFKILKPYSQQDFTYHWVDWHPRPVDSMMGLTGEVSVRTSGPVRLDNPAISTKVTEDLSSASLNLYCDATNLTDNNLTGTATATVKDPAGNVVATVSKSATIPAKKYNHEIAFKSVDFAALTLANPQLWWPAGSGDQPLYTVEWSFTYVGTVSDSLTHRAGLREISYEINVTPLGNQNRTTITSTSGANMAQFYFNHKPVMLKGGGYCPTDLFLRHDQVKNQGVIDNMLYAGLNMMRDEGKFFDNDLLDLCDENGIVVMTGWCCCDRHQSPNNWTKCERFLGYEEQYAQTKNLRQHASAGLWFNGSDQPATFSQSSRSNSWMVEETYMLIEARCRWDEIGATAPSSCLDSSKLLGNINGGFHMDSSYESNSVTYMFNPGAAQNAGEGPFGFISEGLGGANISPLETMKKIIPEANRWPYNSTSYDNFAAWAQHGNIVGLVTLAENAYGASTSLESWHAKATAQSYDQYRAQYEALAYFRYTNNTGLVNWMLNSARPNNYWSEFDFYMNPTAATFGIAKANEPLHIMYNPYNKDISVINSTFEAYDDMTAEVSIYNLDGKPISAPLVTTFDVAPDGVGEVTVYGDMASYTNTNAQAQKWAVKQADGRTAYRNGWHYDEVNDEYSPMLYNYFGQVKDAYGVNILWDYADIEKSLTAPMSDVYFLRLTLKDSNGQLVSTNSYAVPYRGDITCATGWMYGPPVATSDLSALNTLPALSADELTCVQTKSAVVGDNVVQTLVVSNDSPYIAHNVYLAAYPDSSLTDLIGAVQYTDNMFILLPGESRTIDVTHRTSNLAGDAYITVTCYNNQIGGDRPIRFQNIYTGLGTGLGRSLSISKPVTGSGGGTPGNLTTMPANCLNAAIAHNTFIDSALAYTASNPSDQSPTYYTYSPTITDGSAWFYVDLGAPESFDKVMLRFSGSRNLRGRPDSIVIAGSDNATTWTDLATYNNTGGSIMTEIVLPATATYRYVRATLNGGAASSATAMQTAFNVQGMDIYAFNNYMNVSVAGDGVVTGGGKTITEDSTANQGVIVVEDGSIALTFTPNETDAGLRVKLDGVDVTNQLVGNVLTLSGLADGAKLEAYFGCAADIRADEAIVAINAPVGYSVALTGLKDANLITLNLKYNTGYLDLNFPDSYTALNGFTLVGPAVVTNLGNNVSQATVKLMYTGAGGFISNAGQLDVLNATGLAKGVVGNTAVTLADVTITGIDADGNAAYLPCSINTSDAVTSIAFRAPTYSKYDLNRDGDINDLDLSIAIFFYLKSSANSDWETPLYNGRSAKDADVAESGLVDLADLIEILANYCDKYNLYPN